MKSALLPLGLSPLPCFASSLVGELDPADCRAALERVLLLGVGVTAHTQISLCQSSDHSFPLHTQCGVYRNSPLAAKLRGISSIQGDQQFQTQVQQQQRLQALHTENTPYTL